ncbi:MAG TPA: methyltransferase domain-containing protein [Candidatus Latescibacteria bacterium]|nr:methyltransferase domain-containing protein [Candidatus Latescibacterota bacterium]
MHHPDIGRRLVDALMDRYYDFLLDVVFLGRYGLFLRRAVKLMEFRPGDWVLDMGSGTGRIALLVLEQVGLKGGIIGVDASPAMVAQFRRKCDRFPNTSVLLARIDRPLPYRGEFDKVLFSFVLHELPREPRDRALDNASLALKENGELLVLDYNTFSNGVPWGIKLFFRLIEPPHILDFVKQDLKEALSRKGFGDFMEYHLVRGYVRLLKARKVWSS